MPRLRQYRSPAVVLGRLDLGEADRIVTLYTREQGKVRAVAKGSRRTTSRLAGHLELFTLVDVVLAHGRELDIISQVDTIQAFRVLREDVGRISFAFYVAELTNLMTEEHLPNSSVFETVVNSFQWLDEAYDPRLVILLFIVRLLEALGYQPELQECVICRATLAPGANQFAALLGGVVCPRCARGEPSARPFGTDALKLARYLQRISGPPRLTAPEAAVREAESTLRGYAESIMERRLRTPALIHRIQQAAARAGL